MRHASDDCPHPDFESGPVLTYIHGSLWRCLQCRSVWHESTPPVRSWMARMGGLVPDEASPSVTEDGEGEPF